MGSVSKSIVLPFHACSLLVYFVDQWQPYILLISIEIFLFSCLCPFFFFSEVQFNIKQLLCHLCFHHWFGFPVVDVFSLLLTILNL